MGTVHGIGDQIKEAADEYRANQPERAALVSEGCGLVVAVALLLVCVVIGAVLL